VVFGRRPVFITLFPVFITLFVTNVCVLATLWKILVADVM